MSLFSGRFGRRAAMAQTMQAQATQSAIDALLREAQTTARADLVQGRDSALAAVDAGEPRSLAALGEGYDTARADLAGARERFEPWADTGRRGFALYADSAGANGAEGADRATAAFRAGPGYRFAVDQSTDAVARRASALGALGSGNTMAEISDRAGHMADQEFDRWQGRLSDIGRTGYAATGAQAGIDADMARTAAAHGTARAGVIGDNATRRAELWRGGGTSLAGLGTSMAGIGAGALGDTGRSMIAAIQRGQEAGQQARTNTLNLGLGIMNSLATLGGAALGGRSPGGARPAAGAA